jgi:hypothetical protein
MERAEIWMRYYMMPGFSFIFALVFLFTGGSDLIKAIDSYGWNTADGVILRSSIYKENKKKYKWNVEYTYSVNNLHYNSDNFKYGAFINFRLLDSKQNIMNKRVAKYPSGKKIKVYYNPDDASESVVLNGLSGGVFLLPFLGVVFAGAGSLLISDNVKNRKITKTSF